MSTPEQIAQNRKNAQSSTGPKTPEGKAISSQNAVKHGFFAKNDVISGEDLAAYEQHRQDIYDEFVPLTPTESVLTQRIASLTWRLMRADRLQTTTINTLVANQQSANTNTLPQFNIEAMIETLRRKDKDPEYPINDAGIILAGLVRRKNESVTTDPAVDEAIHAATTSTVSNHICEAEIQLGTVIYNDFHGSAVIERLQSYEQRIESSLFKTIRQIQQIQERRIKNDAARDRRGMQYLRAEDEAERNRLEAEYQQNIRNKTSSDRTHAPGVPPVFNPGLSAGDSPTKLNVQNEPNSDLTSVSDITYNRDRQERAKRNHPQNQNPDDRPDRSDNK